MYIDYFQFPGVDAEEQFVNYIERRCYSSFYPFGVFAENMLESLSFSEITILYGNNGSGKSTALNEGVDRKREQVFDEWIENKNSTFRMQ